MVIPILTGPLRGKKWIAGSHNNSVWLGTYERNQSLTFVQKSKGSKIFLDLGAHAGYYTLLYKSVNKESNVYSFEPVESNYDFLLKHIKMNNLENIIHFNKAVADKEGVLRFARGNSVGGKLSLTGDMDVSAIKLSRLVDENIIQFPDLIKMDIEGAEYQVLKDLEPYLRVQKPIIFLSTHGDEIRESCLKLMKSLNYNITPLDDKSMIKAREYLIEPE
ncbi:FkbM family methyltransferase [Gillisia hiemivivida]|nr:FkbM family methyltransferase [Gillisia hiemivivida]